MDTLTTQPPLAAILRGLPPHQASAIGAALYEAGFRIIEVPLNRMSPNMIKAVLSIEDQRFFHHAGVDVWRIFGAAFANLEETLHKRTFVPGFGL